MIAPATVRRLARLTFAGILAGVALSALTYAVAAIMAGAYVALLAGVGMVAVVLPFAVVCYRAGAEAGTFPRKGRRYGQ